MTKVSVVIPNYNHARFLRQRIESVLAQTYQDFELILLDDCSTDDSRKILESYAGNLNVRIEFNEKNSGSVFKQWNKGVQMARGRFIWIAESDDYADPRFLARMVPLLEGHTEVTFAYCRSWSIGEDDQRSGLADSYLDRLDSSHWSADFVADGFEECGRYFVLCAPVANTSAVIFRRDVYEKVGRADEGFRLCGDYKFWAEMALQGKIAYLAEPLNFYRSHAENARTHTRTGSLDVAEFFYVMLSILKRIAPPDTLTRYALMNDVLSRRPIELSPGERIPAAKRSLSCIADWNLRHNPYVAQEVKRVLFKNYEFMLAFREFALSPPGRWRFFLHRYRLYRHSFREMGWKMRFVDLMRVLGAPVVGYRHRHLPEKLYSRVIRKLAAF